MSDRLKIVLHRTTAAQGQPGGAAHVHARTATGWPRALATWLAMMLVMVSLGLGEAWALTITINEFQHATVLLPFVPQQGTLALCENPSVIFSPVTCEAPTSDIVVFLAGLTTGTALLESDLAEPGTPVAPGDRALLIPFPAPFFSVGEPGAEETTQRLLYTPRFGEPGFAVVQGVPVSYAITSDVPEPASWLLLATGGVGLGALTLRRLRKA